MKKIYLYIVICLISFTSCNDFLDVEPKGSVIPTTIEDYDLLLTTVHTMSISSPLFYSADDYEKFMYLRDITEENDELANLFKFKRRYANPNLPCMFWNTFYKQLYTVNKVINEVDASTSSLGYKESDKNRIKAEAKYLRASRYFYLVNFFAKHYSEENKSSLSIPLVTKADIAQDGLVPVTIESVYKLIEEDLLYAVKYLPKKEKYATRPSKGGGYALLSRMYLYQSKYQKSAEYAELALKEKNTLTDYNNLGNMSKIQAMYKEQYTISRFGSTMGVMGNLSPELIALYEPNDTRLLKWFLQYAFGKDWKQDFTKKSYWGGFQPNTLPSIGEMYVTAAECYARLNKTAEALDKLNILRSNRIPTAPAKTSADFPTQKDLLKFSLEERRKELFFSGTRLFDIKRLNLDPEFQKTVVHKFKTDKKVLEFKAEPNSGKLVIPIPANIKKYNENFE